MLKLGYKFFQKARKMTHAARSTLLLFYNLILMPLKAFKIIQFDHTKEYLSKSSPNGWGFLRNKSKLSLTAMSMLHPTWAINFYAWGLPELREPAYNKELIHLILEKSWEDKGKRGEESPHRTFGETQVFDLISPTIHYFLTKQAGVRDILLRQESECFVTQCTMLTWMGV